MEIFIAKMLGNVLLDYLFMISSMENPLWTFCISLALTCIALALSMYM